MNHQRNCCFAAAVALLTLTSCGRSPVRELQKKVADAPRSMVMGTWVGKFEFDDPQILETLSRSINSADREIMQQLRQMARETRWFQFRQDGTVNFYDVGRRREFVGNWDVVFVEGRTVGVNIRTSARYSIMKPVTFLADNVFIIRPRLNGARYEKYGRIVFRRAAAQPPRPEQPDDLPIELSQL